MLCLVVFCNRMDCSLPGSSVHGDSPGKNNEVGCHALLQGIFRTQGSNPGSPTLQMDSLLSEPLGKPCHAMQCGKIKKKKGQQLKIDSFFSRKKQLVTYKGTSIRLQADISAEALQARKKWHNIQNDDRKKATTKNTLPGKPIIQI